MEVEEQKGMEMMEKKNPIVTIEMENGDKICVELYPEIAPNTVNNFISLVKKGFYDGTIFHRVIAGFMIQGGDPEGTGMGGPGYSIKGEFAQNGVENNLNHTEGVISMARAMHPNSAGSQFFIMHKDAPHLDGAYAAFGKVIEGMDVVHAIEKVEVKAIENSKETEKNSSEETKEEKEKSIPVKDVVISKVTVETNGIDYGMPKTLEQWDYYDWIYKTYGIDLRSYQN